MSRSRLVLLGLFVALALPLGTARADVITQDVAECRGKKGGDACMDGKGACVASRCSRLDYSQGSPPRGSIEYDCMRCSLDVKPSSVAAAAKKSHSCATAPGSDASGSEASGSDAFGVAAALFALAATMVLARALRRRPASARG